MVLSLLVPGDLLHCQDATCNLAKISIHKNNIYLWIKLLNAQKVTFHVTVLQRVIMLNRYTGASLNQHLLGKFCTFKSLQVHFSQ